MKNKLFILLLITTIPFFSICQNETGIFIDTRDGQTYKTVKIGNQIWMAENLNFETEDSWCYNNSLENCKTYGRLYTCEAAKNVCPAGWHLPSDAEWTILVDYLGGSGVAGGKMKKAGTSHWKLPNFVATNSANFTALPGGGRRSDGSFFGLGYYAYFWSTIKGDASYAWYRYLSHNYADVYRYYLSKPYSRSVRCVQD